LYLVFGVKPVAGHHRVRQVVIVIVVVFMEVEFNIQVILILNELFNIRIHPKLYEDGKNDG
jgi:hypothetical protein